MKQTEPNSTAQGRRRKPAKPFRKWINAYADGRHGHWHDTRYQAREAKLRSDAPAGQTVPLLCIPLTRQNRKTLLDCLNSGNWTGDVLAELLEGVL